MQPFVRRSLLQVIILRRGASTSAASRADAQALRQASVQARCAVDCQPAPPTPPEPLPAPAPPPAQDVRFKSTYTTGDTKTEGVTYIKGDRERFEFQDMVLIKQHDQKRTIQISRAANTYLVSPDGMPPTPTVPGTPAAPPKTSGTIMITTTIVDTGERKEVFGRQARHVKTMIDTRPMAGVCDTSKQRTLGLV